MARIVILSVPAYGHLNPILPIAKELVRRGHDVTVFNEARFAPLITDTGAGFVAYPPVLTLDDFARVLKGGDLVAWLHLLLQSAGPLLRFTTRALKDNPPDLILFDGVAIWGELAASNLHVPSISISTAFAFEATKQIGSLREVWRIALSYMWHFPGIVVAWHRLIWGGMRKPPWRMPLMPRQGSLLTLMLTSKLVHPQTRLVDNPRFAFIGCSIEPSTRHEQFDFSRLDGRPLLYISLGTLHHGNTEFFRTCIAAFSDFDGQVLVSVGRGTDLAPFASAPDNFIFAEAVPQLAILERAQVFVTHAGLNSVHESLWNGVPMVAVPQQFEQLHNAHSVVASGAGILIDSETWGHPVSVTQLRDAVRDVIGNHNRYAAAARTLGTSLRDGGGYLAAVERIESYFDPHSGSVQPRRVKSTTTAPG